MLDELKKIIKRFKSREATPEDSISKQLDSLDTQAAEQGPKLVTVNRQIVAIANQKGGCAKTTTAINLSALLAHRGYKVLLIDLDPQAHASLGLGIDIDNIERTVYDVLIRNLALEQVIHRTLVDGLEIAPSNSLLSGAQLELASLLGRESVLRIVVRKLFLTKEYDFVFFDCGPSLNLITINALVASDSILIPIQTHYYSLEGMKELFSTIEIVRERLNPDLQILGILATLFDTRTKISNQILQQIRDYFKGMVFNSVIRNNVRLCEAPMYKKPIHLYDPKSMGAQDYFNLMEEVIVKTQRCEVKFESGKVA